MVWTTRGLRSMSLSMSKMITLIFLVSLIAEACSSILPLRPSSVLRGTPTHTKNASMDVGKRNFLLDIRGGGAVAAVDADPTDASSGISTTKRGINSHDFIKRINHRQVNPEAAKESNSVTSDEENQSNNLQQKESTTLPRLHIQAVLLPRQTSILTPLRFLSFLLMNVSFNYCMQTAGKPMEDAVRRVLNMPSPTGPGSENLSSKVTQLHIYVAKKILSSSSSLTNVDILPPAHLPSPLPLLGLFVSILLYLGGAVLLPKWSVHADAFLNYERFDLHDDDDSTIIDASNRLWNWFEEQMLDDVDPYYQSTSKKPSLPAVLVIESKGAVTKETICPLYASPEYEINSQVELSGSEHHFLDHPRRYYFECNGKRIYYDPIYQTVSDNTAPLICGGPNLDELPICKLLSDDYKRGLRTASKLSRARERYGSYSHISIPVPTLTGTLVSRMTSPLVALQLVGRLLSVLEDETIGKSIANLARLGFQHISDAKRSIEAATTLANEVKENEDLGEQGSGIRIWAVRPVLNTTIKRKGKTIKQEEDKEVAGWIEIPPSELLPGDVFIVSSLSESSYFAPAVTIPVDALLLEGTCVTEEAALTGESVPQAKVPLDTAMGKAEETSRLHMSGHHRSSCLFAGTKLLQSINDQMSNNKNLGPFTCLPALPRELSADQQIPTLFLALRSGSYSSRGEIIQSLVKAKTDVGAVSNEHSQLDSMRLIGVLSAFAVGACIYLLSDSTSNKQADSVFKKVVQCTRIAVASVPSDLPVSLSASARACAAILREESDAICSKPEALLESSKVDCLVFDKTGTLTSDTQALVSVQYPKQQKGANIEYKFLSDLVLAGSHTLIGMNSTLIGDPLDKACLDFSCWRYESDDKSATFGNAKLWQIRTFPFDSDKKMSSAIVLACHNDGTFHLWVVVKGASNRIQNLLGNQPLEWYSSQVRRLGEMGYRTIALAALDASETEALVLFPSGLPKQGTATEVVEHMVQKARSKARNIHRHDVETYPSGMFDGIPFSLAGVASFTAPLRVSTNRIVCGLKQANVTLKMLTGDDFSTSLAVAKRAGMLDELQNVHLLKLNQTGALIWETNKRVRELNLSTAKRINRDIGKQDGILAVEGNVIRELLSGAEEQLERRVVDYVRDELLSEAMLITAASPGEKHLFVNWLQSAYKKHVLMCGDGVNDIAAMTEAHVSVAMMSGFSKEASDSVKDIDDMVRMERLKRRRIGSNRLTSIRATPSLSEEECIGIGDSPIAVSVRLQSRISDGLRRLENQQKGPSSTTPLTIVASAIKEEFHRYKNLKRGGSGAARIMAEEDRLRRSLQKKSSVDSTADVSKLSEESSVITTGEACLAACFTLLRPSVSGVETIMRAGISAAACGISLYRKVALNCILSCYNLATLYKNGVRYGKWMWQCELTGIVTTERASFAASSMPRPRLVANIRPSPTPFHPAEVLSTACQAIIHIVTLTLAVSNGKQLESIRDSDTQQHGFRIKWMSSSEEKTPSVGAVLASLVDIPASTLASMDSCTATPPQQSFLRRSPFQPNHISNNVFIMSVFQNAVMALVNHPGRPFSVSFLESRSLCLSVWLSFMLCIVCIAETFPLLNRCIQLAPFPSKASKIALLRLLLLNVSLNYFAEYLSTFWFRRDIWEARNEPSNVYQHHENSALFHAADQEEKLLHEERTQNVSILYVMLIIGCSILVPQIMP